MATPDTSAAARTVISHFLRRHPTEAARALERLSAPAAARWVEAVPAPQGAAVLERLMPEFAARTLTRMPDTAARRALTAMDPGRAVSLLDWLDPEMRERRVADLEPGAARELRTLAAYPDDSAGRLMDPRAVSQRHDATAREALAALRTQKQPSDGEVLVVDADGRLSGVAAWHDIAAARLSDRIGDLARPVASVLAMATRAEVMERLAGGQVTSLPVVDVEGRLVGVIRAATLLSIAREEAGASLQTMVGASRDERALSPVSFAVRKRLPWLQVNLLTAFLAAAVVGLFEDTIAQITALAVLLPVVAGQSGNTGAQALAVTMRGLALREIRPRLWRRITFKEGSVAAVNGVAVALTTSAAVLVWSQSPGLALVIGIAMVISMVAAGLAGALIPIVLTVSGQDPAQASSIVLTTVTDVVGFLSFLGLASLFAAAL